MHTTEDGLAKIEATFENDTVWLSLEQMAELFQRDKSTVPRHIKNIYREGERPVIRKIEYYNLDVIISVGYRVKSLRGT